MALFDTECKTCKVLQEALEYERERNKELIETITALVKPAPIIQQTINPQAINKPIGLTFTRRRAELEKADRARAEAEKSPHKAIPDKELVKTKTVEQLEQELGVSTVTDSVEKGA